MPNIEISTLDNLTFAAHVAAPKGGHGAGLLLVRGLFATQEDIEKKASQFSELGYLVVSPNLFHRQAVTDAPAVSCEPDWDHASRLYKNFDVEAGVRDLLATVAYVRRMPECSGKVGVVGYCLGSRLAYLMMTRSDIDCGVGYYGVGIETMLDEVYDIRMPFLLHVAENDKLLQPSVRQRLLTSLAKNKHIQTHLYPGVEHGFAREKNMTYNEPASLLAQQRTEDFLQEHLMG